MTVGECLRIASEWVAKNEACIEGFVGAYAGGSAAAMPDSAEITGGSDMDVYVVLRNPAPDKRGKFEYEGALLEISYIDADAIFPAEKALRDYHLANSLRYRRTIADRDGSLGLLQAEIAGKFAMPEYVKLRRDHAISRVKSGLGGLDFSRELPDLTLSWLFPTGITTHAVLVAALRNPTVRLRYLRAREVLEGMGKIPDYEELLDVSGFSDATQEGAGKLLSALEPIYDTAAKLGKTYFFFASDVSPQSRATAIDASRALIERNFHRETLFWTITTYARSMRMLLTDAPDEYARFLPDFQAALDYVQRGSEGLISAAAHRALTYLCKLNELTDSIIANTPE